MSVDAASLASAFLAGLLAGEEFVICFGVRQPLAALAPQPHIEMRQGLIRTLRVLVPILFALTLFSGLAATIIHWNETVQTPRVGSVALLLAFIILTLLGTAPINKAVGSWDAAAPPQGWQATIRRWEVLDSMRTALAIGAFTLALLSLTCTPHR